MTYIRGLTTCIIDQWLGTFGAYMLSWNVFTWHDTQFKGFNSLGDFNEILEVIPMLISVIDGWGISCEIAPRWMSLHLSDDKSTLVQVMAWCHQASGHYLRQCRPRSMLSYQSHGNEWIALERITDWSKPCFSNSQTHAGFLSLPILWSWHHREKRVHLFLTLEAAISLLPCSHH